MDTEQIRQRDPGDPDYMAGITADGEALARDLAALIERYPDIETTGDEQ